MKRSLKVILAGLLTFTVLFSTFTASVQAETITADKTGTHDGYYYTFWNQGGGSVAMTLGSGGNYSVTWSNCANFYCGKGWNSGSAKRVVNYSGTFNGGNNGYLALYGWTKNPLIEYYVIENHGAWTPPGSSPLGTFNSDGGTYTIYKSRNSGAPSISEISFVQYFSVRKEKRSSGTITFGNHIKAWEEKGMKMGTTWEFQIMSTEGYQSSGSSNITISEEPSQSPTQKPTPIPTIPATGYTGDFNNDGFINMADIMIIAKAFGSVIGDVRYDPLFDLNNDGSINMADIMIIAFNFNRPTRPVLLNHS